VEAASEDLTRVYESEDLDWIPLPDVPKGEAHFKVIHADEERNVVVFKFRFGAGCELVPHTHECHAIAYTLSGEWEYEGLKLPVGAVAYEPEKSVHTPSSENGAELVVVLRSDSDRFLINHMPDGSEVVFDMAFFKAFDGATVEQAQALLEQMG
jgi:hypothetical protein